MKRLLITGVRSGCGKTTTTCALLSAFHHRGVPLTAFKCGPDYIDPMFHRAVSGVPCWNLDPFFIDGNGLRAHLARHGSRDGLSLIEGAMGFYDGVAMSDEASAHTVAVETETPAVLVVDATGAGHSLAAVIEGFVRHRQPSGIRGVIFNGASAASYPDYRKLAEKAGVEAFGFLPRHEDWAIGHRHLGLVTATEISDLTQKLAALGEQAEKTLDLDGLLTLAATAPERAAIRSPNPSPSHSVRIAVAKDEAFCFIYAENIELLEALGAEIVWFSPLRDDRLPAGVGALYLPGGYPELHVRELSANAAMRASIRDAVRDGLPTIAECGGFLYLHETLDGFAMAGVIEAAAFRTERLQRFGYVTLTARHDTLLCPEGGTIRAHEFHYWESAAPGSDFIGRKPGREIEYPCIHATNTLHAGFPHLYLPANPAFAERFVNCGVQGNHSPCRGRLV
ncbi:MAG: cobyrinate a,c-diamide synthase [Candidatus Accumulibacter sp.]|jgi:cobyrinic acid a,c-diamide synthase|nr:cobyrinate a,c-diamide synthase [Accumulibacter sp.]